MIFMCINSRPLYLTTLLLVCMAVSHVSVAADQAAADLSRINIGELSQVQSETLLYTAQAARARAQEEIVNGGKTPPAGASQAVQPTYVAPAPVNNAQPLLPVVKTVFRAKDALHATLLYAGGYEVDASMGSAELPGGYKVISVSLESVVLGHSGRRYPLGFSTRPPSAVAEASQMSSQSLGALIPGQPSPLSQPATSSQEELR